MKIIFLSSVISNKNENISTTYSIYLFCPLYQLVSDQIEASLYFKKILQYFSLCIIGSERKSRALCRLKNQEVSPGRQGSSSFCCFLARTLP